jgi:simple sugar transport system substrate-binding protein
VTDRAGFLRRAGAGAAGASLAQLFGPAAAFGGDGGGDFPAHPRWRFVFVSHDTLNPLFVATQFGAQDAAALVRCSIEWTGSPHRDVKETVRALHSAISRKADGIIVSVFGERVFASELEAAARAKIPLVTFSADSGSGRLPYVGENAYASGVRAGSEIARLIPRTPVGSPRSEVVLFAPERGLVAAERRLKGMAAGLAGAAGPAASVVRLAGSLRSQQTAVEAAVAKRTRVRGLFAVDGAGTLAVGTTIKKLGLSSKGIHAGGYDLLPVDFDLVADGHLDFVVDQQPYVQGFTPVIQLFLAKISEGTVSPSDVETSILLRRADVQTVLATKSRFEGSSSRHEYPLRRV